MPALALVFYSFTALAQQPLDPAASAPDQPAEVVATPKDPTLRPVEVPEAFGRATESERELRAIRASAEIAEETLEILEELDAAVELATTDADDDLARLESVVNQRVLRDIRSNWTRELARFENWNHRLTRRVREIEKSLVRIDELEALWQKAQQDFTLAQAPDTVLERVAATLEQTEAVRKVVSTRRADLLELQARVGTALEDVLRMLTAVEVAEQDFQRGLLDRDAPNLFEAISTGRMTDEVMGRELDALRRNLTTVRDYVRDRSERILAHVMLGLLAILAMSYLSRVAGRWPADDEAVRASAAVLTRPYACAILIIYALTPFLYPSAPSFFYHLVGLIVLVPLSRLLQPLLDERDRPIVYAIVGFYALDVARELMAPLITLERIVFMVEMVSFAFVLSRLLRSGRTSRLVKRNRYWPLTTAALRLGVALLAIAVVANGLGYVSLATAFGQGVFSSTYFALAAYGLYRVLEGAIVVALRSSVTQHLNMVRGHRAKITRSFLRLVSLILVAAWFWRTLVAFSAESAFAAAALGVLREPIAIGDLVFRLGDVATFLAVFFGALWFSRLLRFTLEQDVLPRMRLPRGVPYAITATLHYGILFVAAIAALTAAGIDLSKFSILAGALGVGVGFGLQNVVNNFVSGLILLLERPVQTEDVVEVGTLLGTVRRIGIRSSTLRTFDGAEVIVPNANLISDQVVNWTLSDRQRRVEINVGVAYGNDPERVIDLLEQAAHDDARILERPAPEALFLGFGDSSLDFQMRAWTALYSEWLEVRSRLYISVYKRLQEAGIEIPFPQRDLHVRDVAGAAATAPGRTEDPV